MQNITTHLSKDTIKPELAHVYVHKDETGKVFAVATDSFRLARLNLTGTFLEEFLPVGYYTKAEWLAITKEVNKKKADIKNIMDILNLTKLKNDPKTNVFQYKDFNYPEYTRILPNKDDLRDFDATLTYDAKYFADFCQIVSECNVIHDLEFSAIKNGNNGILYYKNNGLELLLMPLIK
jgi:DNA polymerase III sliding clamp (beta) subunit (PCNA family)